MARDQKNENYDEHDAQDDQQKSQLSNAVQNAGKRAYNNHKNADHSPKSDESKSNASNSDTGNKKPTDTQKASPNKTSNTSTSNASNAGSGATKGVTGAGKAGSDVAKGVNGAGKAGTGLAKGASGAAGPAGAALAAAQKATEALKKIGETSQEATSGSAKKKTKASDKNRSTTTSTDNNIVLKIVAVALGIVIAIAIIVIIILETLLGAFIKPVMYAWKTVTHVSGCVSEIVSDIGKDEDDITYQDIVGLYTTSLQGSLKSAYLETCYKEVYQIAIENDYDLDLTLDSYNNTEFPYVLEGSSCNVNYSELLSLISLGEGYGSAYFDFDYDALKELLNSDEFKRCLYDLKVVPTEKNVIKEEFRDSCTLNDDGSVTVKNSDGSTTTYSGDTANDYIETVIYGEVTVSRYPLKKLYDYFEVDPYAQNKTITTMNNRNALTYMDHFSRSYYGSGELFGYEQSSQLYDYEVYTGELTTQVENVFAKDVNKYSVITEDYVKLEVPLYKQGGGQPWSDRKYGSGNMAKLGCCVTSMAMVCDYYSSMAIDPGVLLTHIDRKYNGSLIRPSVAEDFGFKGYVSSPTFNTELAKGELVNNRLVIAHIRSGSKGTGKFGHYVVLTGFSCTPTDENGGYFFVNEPASRLDDTISLQESKEVFDSMWSYGF